jgi:beta-phosphoglucomutase-like phosphatase (HAD superfamily)
MQGAVFDMDGLLIDTEPVWRQSEIEIFGRLGLHLSEEQSLGTMGMRVAEVVRLWYDRHPWSGPSVDEVTREIVDTVIRHVTAHGEPKAGVLAALTTIHHAGLPIAIASSSSEALIRAVVQRLHLEPYITAICSAEDEREGKPHPAVYLRAAARLGVPPERCLAFEDSPNGVLSARAAGMYCIVVPDPYLASDPRMMEADLRLASLEEFTPPLFEELRKAALARPG